MRNVKAIFKKQFKGTIQNPETMIQFAIFPALAWLMGFLVVTDFYGIPYDIAAMMAANMPNMVTMQATIFAGMALIPVVTSVIAGDVERKSIRFLTMAGVSPMSYLIGVGGVILLAGFASSVAFSFIGGFEGRDFWIFTAAMMSGVAASTVLGAIFGVMTSNQQSASALSMPAAIVLGFGPMMAQMNENIARYLHPIYTQQLNVVAEYLERGYSGTPLWQAFAIMWANVAVICLLFALVYHKKGLTG
ncbi:MAG: ABC transporter permease [Defluviitaleaceae bacterium]|nr:ABC transporter permease [Defluviitaleaceae bacterium]MCL2275328.1 ABC transporter permease [Defluviitaleaceae bacterium]